MNLMERCTIDGDVAVVARPPMGESAGFYYRWIALNEPVDKQTGWISGQYDVQFFLPSNHVSVLELKEDMDTAIVVPEELGFKLEYTLTSKSGYTELTFCRGMKIHLSRIWLQDNKGAKLLLGDDGLISEGSTWYLPREAAFGKGSSGWKFVKDAYCDQVLTIQQKES